MVPVSDYLTRVLVLTATDIYDLLIHISSLDTIASELRSLDSLVEAWQGASKHVTHSHLLNASLQEIKLVIVDNVATPLRLFVSRSIDQRLRVVNKLGRDLRLLAARLNCAVLTVNQMTTKMAVDRPSQPSRPADYSPSVYRAVPSLGHTWEAHLDTSILLQTESKHIRYDAATVSSLIVPCAPRLVKLLRSVHLIEPLVSADAVTLSAQPIRLELNVSMSVVTRQT